MNETLTPVVETTSETAFSAQVSEFRGDVTLFLTRGKEHRSRHNPARRIRF